MAERTFVAYYRSSPDPQARPGLDAEEQHTAVQQVLARSPGRLVGAFTEVETGPKPSRPALRRALRACQQQGATLVLPSLDRLSREASFLRALEQAGVEVLAPDLPDLTRHTVGLLARVAEAEQALLSRRIRAGLARKRAWYANLTPEQRRTIRREGKIVGLGGCRGVVISDEARAISLRVRQSAAEAQAEALGPVLAELRASGVTSLGGLARALMERRIATPRGKARWTPTQVGRVLARLP